MLFSSFEFIFVFFPIVFFGYYLLARFSNKAASGAFLALASLFFYAYWKPAYLPLILSSIAVNYIIGIRFIRTQPNPSRNLLIAGIVFNLGLLGYFKYSWFAIETVAFAIGSQYRIDPLLLPLAISFFTFQQVAFLVDAYKGEIQEVRFSSYTLFVSFFPQLIAGPIVHHREMMPQFEAAKRNWPTWINVGQGLRIFMFGLAKKLILADTLAVYADSGWANASELTLWAAWGTTLCYTFQLYFDFSGYSDMAMGAARFFGIHLPVNFNSPYKATNIQDFWSRWHMTLSRWLRDYLYIPLGGNRIGRLLTYRNLFLTFLLGGIWHGAGWTFIFWGMLHGIGCIIHRIWSQAGLKMPKTAGWIITFIYAHIGWVFFRASSLSESFAMLKKMTEVRDCLQQLSLRDTYQHLVGLHWLKQETTAIIPQHVLLYLIVAAGTAFMFKNSIEYAIQTRVRYPKIEGLLLGTLAFICLLSTIQSADSPFLYFNF